MQRHAMQLGCLLVVFVFLLAGCLESDPLVGPQTTGQAVDPDPIVEEVPGPVTMPFRGHYTTTFTPSTTPPPVFNFDIFGVGVATVVGASTWEGPTVVDLTQVPPVQTGTAVFTTADGDEFLMTYAGIAFPGPDPVFDVGFSGGFTLSDGTGRFAGVTGSGSYHGTASNSLAIGEITYEGTITAVRPPDPPPGHDK